MKDASIFWIVWSAYMGSICLFVLFKIFISYKNKVKDENVHLNCKKIVYAREVVRWCSENLGMPSKIKYLPQVEIKYYRHKKLLGNYNASQKKITLYLNSHDGIVSFTNTIIHEYQHFLDIKNSKEQKQYAKVLEDVGYQDHPLELSARKSADQYGSLCVKEMIRQGVLAIKQ